MTGPKETGFPVEEHRTIRQLIDSAGRPSEHVTSWSTRVVELSTERQDDALFQIPPDFRLAPGEQVQSPGLWGRLVNWWCWVSRVRGRPSC